MAIAGHDQGIDIAQGPTGQTADLKTALAEREAVRKGAFPNTEVKKTGSELRIKGEGCEFRIAANRGKVFAQFKSRRNKQWVTVFVINESGGLGLTSRATQNYVPRAGEAPR